MLALLQPFEKPSGCWRNVAIHVSIGVSMRGFTATFCTFLIASGCGQLPVPTPDEISTGGWFHVADEQTTATPIHTTVATQTTSGDLDQNEVVPDHDPIEVYNHTEVGFQTIRDIAVAADGTVIVVGESAVGGLSDLLIAKLRPNGETEWTVHYNEGSAEEGFSVALDSDENIVVVGSAFLGLNQDVLVQKRSPSGDLIWTHHLDTTPEDVGTHLAIDTNDNIYVAAHVGPGSSSDTWFAKLDSEGQLLSQKRLSSESASTPTGIVVSDDSRIFIADRSHTTVQVHGFDNKFVKLFTRAYESELDIDVSEQVMTQSIALTSDDRLHLVGNTRVENDAGELRSSYWLRSFTLDGDELPEPRIQRIVDERVLALAVDANDNILAAGSMYSWETRSILASLRLFDSAGAAVWRGTYARQPGVDQRGATMARSPNGALLFLATNDTTNGQANWSLVQFDAEQ